MSLKIDFVGSEKAGKDYDACVFRYTHKNRSSICVFDAGTLNVGEELVKHIETYYVETPKEMIDTVICSHPHEDHASGLKYILENFRVRTLVMNRPWEYAKEIREKIVDGDIEVEVLKQELRETYKHIADIETIAKKKGVFILPGIVGSLYDEMTILSPTKEFLIQCFAEAYNEKHIKPRNVADSARSMRARWGEDAIREGEKTSPINETSIVLYVHPDEKKTFLLLGDVGCRGLKNALDYADASNYSLKECCFVHVPHHGSRHNVSPSILDRLVGEKVVEGLCPTKNVVASVCEGSDHPRKSVVNAFIHRGCKVYATRGRTLCYYNGEVLQRIGFIPVQEERYSYEVETWDDDSEKK